MAIRPLTAELSVSPQMAAHDLPAVAAQGAQFDELMAGLPKPVPVFLASRQTAAAHDHRKVPPSRVRLEERGAPFRGKTPVEGADATHDLVIVGVGAADIAVVSSLLARSPGRDVAFVDPADIPVVAHDLLVSHAGAGCNAGVSQTEARHNGYGSCPLTVQRGEIVLAEFLYGAKLAPGCPTWLIDGSRPFSLAVYLKERILPPLVGQGMPEGGEWMAQPKMVG